ncbi:glutamine-hydrolyzing carbamoyl-phosphate synthase small subunit [Rhodoferax sp. 4810]|uniref:Carbamoyl phosphate synthase small chain n=1 Tax=Thiospirillum jenense TaxID=1653858 RepID=A0A839HI94_9GAMM|nr:glutamine-hydrolyzing carbamoyl-phosphate synthase small subunit [Thiospirillum jenense]MBB1074789.1 glutamine-hydrolyzing carbamoyl-phosphate synthase small subunit [Rhodoferax jenense]MBB1126627.1 glutamine-hydrolyzing carbamoyl-phosphate synthase small subunit [Thiospirillum jenense]
MTTPAVLVLEDGAIFRGVAIGATGERVGEVVFNTAMTGYQEILTDPSYLRQLVTLTYPHIGNTGVTPEDAESSQVQAAGLIVRDLPAVHSNWRSRQSLPEYLIAQNVVAISEVDTRRLTRLLREKGAQNGCLQAGMQLDETAALEAARAFPGLKGMDLAQIATTSMPYTWTQGSWSLATGDPAALEFTDPQLNLHVVAYDFGIKRAILRQLVDHGCRVTVVPARTSAAEVLNYQPDGIFLSNGPGDPAPCDYAIHAIQSLLTSGIPVFGICLGHQLLGLACGAQTIKMKFGHHGANHPVVSLENGAVMISSQNHGFAVDESSLPATVLATHRSLFDGSLQGIRHRDYPAFSFQGHPEASPGPHDVAPLFTAFVAMMRQRQPLANQD